MPVSHETIQKFELYLTLLRKWQKTINLVSAETLDTAMERHISDSLQLLPYLPDRSCTLMDWGSGAGFPGLVLAMARPDITVHLVESDQRKCAFQQVVSRETKTPVKIHDVRIESLTPAQISTDIITARAFAPLPLLLKFGLPWAEANPALKFILPKGQKMEEEIMAARKNYDFALQKEPSQTEPGAAILVLTGLCISKAS